MVNCALDSPLLSHTSALFIYGYRTVQTRRLLNRACLFLFSCSSVAPDLRIRWTISRRFDRWAEMSVRVQKAGFMVEALWYYNFGSFLFLISLLYIYLNIHIYIYIYISIYKRREASALNRQWPSSWGSKKGTSSHDDLYGHHQDKRRPSTYKVKHNTNSKEELN